MFISPTTSKPISSISIEDSIFATITSVHDDGEVDIELNFKVSQLYAIKVDAYSVNVTVRNARIPLTNTTMPLAGLSVAKNLINNTIKQGQMTKGAANSNTQSIVDFKRGDVLRSMNKSTLTQLHNFSIMNDKEFLKDVLTTYPYAVQTRELRRVIDARSSSTQIPVLQRYMVNNDYHDVIVSLAKSKQQAVNNDSTDQSVLLNKFSTISKSQMRYSSLLESVSPSMIDPTNTHVLSANDALAGVTRHSPAKTQHLGELIDALTLPSSPTESTVNDLSNEDRVITLAKRFVDYVPICVTVTIPNPWDKAVLNANGTVASYYVTIELTDSNNGVTTETITKNLDISSLMNMYVIPKKQPRVLTSVVKQAQSCLDIVVDDPIASDVIIYRKTISPVTQLDIDSKFEMIGTQISMSNKLKRLTNVGPGKNIHVYRVIPVGSSKTIGSSFTDVVVSGDRRFYNKFVSVTVFPSRTGTTIELRGLSHDVVSAHVIRRDVTLHDKEFIQIGDAQLVTDEVRNKNALFFYDYELKTGHSYEYSAMLTFKGGTKQQFGSAIIEYLAFVDGVDTQISDVQIIKNGNRPDVSFNLLTRISKSNLDDVAAMLEAQNMKTYFSDDILNEKEKLEDLIAHNVIRVNLTEGIREDFGVITDSLFVDSVNRKRNAVSDIDDKNLYRYEVTALLRAPETVIEELVREVTDSTGKTYRFNPSKFLHPITLTRGNIFTVAALDAHYGKKPMMFGRVGNLETVNVVFPRANVSVSNATASNYGKNTVNVVWTISGDQNTIDHFIIMSISNNVKRIVGTAHPHYETKECRFIHDLTSADRGYVRYSIIPVLNDYSQLSETLTNNLVIQ